MQQLFTFLSSTTCFPRHRSITTKHQATRKEGNEEAYITGKNNRRKISQQQQDSHLVSLSSGSKRCRRRNCRFCLCRPQMHAHHHGTQRKKIPKPKKTTTLSAGIRHTPDTSSTRTTPPSVSRGRISVESPTLDTGPFTLPLSGEGTGRAAGRVDMKRNNLKQTAFAFLSPGAGASLKKTKNTRSVHNKGHHHSQNTTKQSWRITHKTISQLYVADSKNTLSRFLNDQGHLDQGHSFLPSFA